MTDDATTDGSATRRSVLAGTIASGLAGLGAGSAAAQGDGNETGGGGGQCFALSSPAFDHGGRIPTQYTCDGQNASPPLRVTGVPMDAAALALVVDDPDAPRDVPFTHWLAWNLPARTGQVPEGMPPAETGPGGARQGRNDGGDLGYTGPCPPEGTHTYRFRAYALDARLDVEAGAQRQEVVRAIADHAVAIALLTGEYSRDDGGDGGNGSGDGGNGSGDGG